jgi:hypothetical protein
MTNGSGTAILIAIIAVIIIVILRIFYPNELIIIMVSSLAVFSFMYIIATQL